MKCFVIFVILIVVVELSLASAYAAEQQTVSDKPTPTPNLISEFANLSFQLGIAYQQAQQSQNVTVFNSLVDQYNAWVRQHLSEGADALLRSKINVTDSLGIAQKQQLITETEITHITETPFNASSELSKFGKQKVMRDLGPGGAENLEAASADRILENF